MWIAGRAIDYHERNAWAIIWVAMSPTDEIFVYREYAPLPTKTTTSQIARHVVDLSMNEKYVVNLIDPLANKIQPNTGKTVVEDLNDEFFKLKRRGLGTGGYWEPYDTRGTLGRESIRQRLRNSIKCKTPFNNRIHENNFELLLPTMWAFRSCPETIKSLRQWRYEEWGHGDSLVNKDRKESPAQKFSHFCTALEGLLKDTRFRARKPIKIPLHKRPDYFKNRG